MYLRAAAAALAASTLAACATQSLVTPLVVHGRFDAYGDYDATPPSRPTVEYTDDVSIFYGMAPDGFAAGDRDLRVEAGYGHRVIGTVRVVRTEGDCSKGVFRKRDVIDAMRVAAFQRGGNAVIYATSNVSDEPTDVCAELDGRLDFGGGWIVVLGDAPAPEAPPATAASWTAL
jgi:hypothetical protein